MAKYTSEEVIRDRKCGLKYFDRAVDQIGIEAIIDNAIASSKNKLGTFENSYQTFPWNWAFDLFGSAWRNCIKEECMASLNLHEMMSWEQLKRFSNALDLDINTYRIQWARKKSPYKLIPSVIGMKPNDDLKCENVWLLGKERTRPKQKSEFFWEEFAAKAFKSL